MTPEERTKMLREQVNSKILWGTTEEEVFDWLQEKHGVSEEQAERYIKEAVALKRIAVRKKATVNLAISSVGILIPIIYAWVQMGKATVDIGVVAYAIFGIGIVSLIVFFRSLFQYLNSDTKGTVE